MSPCPSYCQLSSWGGSQNKVLQLAPTHSWPVTSNNKVWFQSPVCSFIYIYIWKNKNRISFFNKKEKKRHHLLWLGKSVSHKGSMSNRLFWEIFIYCALFVGSTFDHNQVQDKSIRNRADDGSLSPVLYSASGRWNEQPCSFSMYCSNALRLVCRGEHPAHILYYLLKNFLPCLSCKETSWPLSADLSSSRENQPLTQGLT